MKRNVYPFQVPAVSTTAASRGPVPRDNFRVMTVEEENASPNGTAQENQLVRQVESTVASSEVRQDSEAAKGPEL